MKPYPVNFKFRAEFDLMPSWLPQVLQDWLEEGWTCDITVKRTTQPLTGRRVLVVKITASTSEDLAAKRKALNKMIEAKGYGPNVLRLRPKMK